jgi:hypothetical protein
LNALPIGLRAVATITGSGMARLREVEASTLPAPAERRT